MGFGFIQGIPRQPPHFQQAVRDLILGPKPAHWQKRLECVPFRSPAVSSLILEAGMKRPKASNILRR